MNLETLAVLADNRQELTISVEPDGPRAIIRRDGFPDVAHHAPLPIQDLTRILDLYPRTVRINGKAIRRRKPSGLSRASILRPAGPDIHSQDPVRLGLGAPAHEGRTNAVAGGVRVHLVPSLMREAQPRAEYLSEPPGLGPAQYHNLDIITLETLMEIQTDEIGELRQGSYGIEIPRDSSLAERVMERVQNAVKRTMELPGMPRMYRGEVFHHALIGEDGDRLHTEPAPIRVMGTPVLLPDEPFQDGRYVSAADALLSSRSRMVPVSGTASRRQFMGAETFREPQARIVHTQFTFEPAEPRQVQAVESITLQATTNRGETLEAPARFSLDGGWDQPISIRVAQRSGVQQDELLRAMQRAFWHSQQWDSPYEEEAARYTFEQRMENLANYVTGDQSAALRAEIQQAADRFQTDLPQPEEPLTVTSRDGRITITINGRGTE